MRLAAVLLVLLAAAGARGQDRPPLRITITIVIEGATRPTPGPTPTPAPPPGPTPGPDPAPPLPPLPGPGPLPGPTPEPGPAVVGPLFATLVHVVDEPSTARLRVSDVKAQLAALDCRWYAAPESSPTAAAFKPYTDRVGFPVAVVTDGSGKVLSVIRAPTKPADVVGPVKALRGVK